MLANIQPNNPMPVGGQGELQPRHASVLDERVCFGPYVSVACGNHRRSQRLPDGKQSGFTLVELMVVVAVLAILATIGIPGFQGIVAQNRATSAANELLATLQFARSTAIAQSRPVTVRPTDGDWHGGWIVEMGENADLVVLRESPALRPSVSLDGVTQLRFSSTGTLVGGQDLTAFVVNAGTGAIRRICMTLGGSSKVIGGGEAC